MVFMFARQPFVAHRNMSLTSIIRFFRCGFAGLSSLCITDAFSALGGEVHGASQGRECVSSLLHSLPEKL